MTGFKDGDTEFAERQEVYRQLTSVIPNTVLLYRPIIQNQNDSQNLMETMLGLCLETNTCLVYSGFYDNFEGTVRKQLATETEELLLYLARKAKVTIFPKSACATSHLLKTQCFAHIDNTPNHLDVITNLYSDRFDRRSFLLKQGTRGDHNFVRFITGRSPLINSPEDHDFLSIQFKQPLLCSSSWFSWSHVVQCDIGCWYCLTEYVFPDSKKPEFIGCNPSAIAVGLSKD